VSIDKLKDACRNAAPAKHTEKGKKIWSNVASEDTLV
jgi:hypothetical protein